MKKDRGVEWSKDEQSKKTGLSEELREWEESRKWRKYLKRQRRMEEILREWINIEYIVEQGRMEQKLKKKKWKRRQLGRRRR